MIKYMDNEIWKEIKDFSRYKVSNLGNLKNKRTGKLLKCHFNACNYSCLGLKNDDDINKGMLMHRIVAIAFIPNPKNKETVNHIDHDTSNNKLDNLEWASITEQNKHKRKCKKETLNVVLSRSVWRIDMNTNKKIEKYITTTDAAKWLIENKLTSIKDFDKNGSSITSRICYVTRKDKIGYGYKWKYDDAFDKYENEIWKNIPPKLIDDVKDYKISNYGRLKNNKERITEGTCKKNNYLRVHVRSKEYSLHRLVANVFIPNPDNKEQVNHKDGNKQNAKLENLEWMTRVENIQHAHDTGLCPKTQKIIQYDLNMKKINEHKSCEDASRILKMNVFCIRDCCWGQQKTSGGFIFKFAGEDQNKKVQDKIQIKKVSNKIVQYDLNMNKIKEYNSPLEASKLLKIGSNNISRCCLGNRKTANGFIFKFAEVDVQNKKVQNTLDIKKSDQKIVQNTSQIKKSNQKNSSNSTQINKKIVQYGLGMIKIKEYNSHLEASKFLKIASYDISKCCVGKRKTAGGFIFKFAEEN